MIFVILKICQISLLKIFQAEKAHLKPKQVITKAVKIVTSYQARFGLIISQINHHFARIFMLHGLHLTQIKADLDTIKSDIFK